MYSCLIVLVAVASAAAFPDNRDPYKEAPRPYSYQYAVQDDYAGTNFNANENSDGSNVKGSYQVLLPDGRTQTVTYTADHYNGYIADVQYQGQAKYTPAPAPSYKPSPPAYGGGHSFF